MRAGTDRLRDPARCQRKTGGCADRSRCTECRKLLTWTILPDVTGNGAVSLREIYAIRDMFSMCNGYSPSSTACHYVWSRQFLGPSLDVVRDLEVLLQACLHLFILACSSSSAIHQIRQCGGKALCTHGELFGTCVSPVNGKRTNLGDQWALIYLRRCT